MKKVLLFKEEWAGEVQPATGGGGGWGGEGWEQGQQEAGTTRRPEGS